MPTRYVLPPASLRCFCAIASQPNGVGQREVADLLGLTLTPTKIHIKRLLEATVVTRVNGSIAVSENGEQLKTYLASNPELLDHARKGNLQMRMTVGESEDKTVMARAGKTA